MDDALWGIMLVMLGLEKIAGVCCYTATSLFLNNSVHPSMAGKVNGISYTIAGAMRSLGPTVGGAIFAWSVSKGRDIGFPLDVNLIFIIFGAFYLLCNVLCAFLPRRLEIGMKRDAVIEINIEAADERPGPVKSSTPASKSARL